MDEGNEEADGRARASADEPAGTSAGRTQGIDWERISDDICFPTIEIAQSVVGRMTKPGKWKNPKVTIDFLCNTLIQHIEGQEDGPALLQGAVIDGERKAAAIKHLDLLILDVDVGQDIEEVSPAPKRRSCSPLSTRRTRMAAPLVR